MERKRQLTLLETAAKILRRSRGGDSLKKVAKEIALLRGLDYSDSSVRKSIRVAVRQAHSEIQSSDSESEARISENGDDDKSQDLENESEAGQEAVKEAEESMDAVEGGAKDPSESEAGQEAVKEAEESMDAVEGGAKDPSESEAGQEAVKEAEESMDADEGGAKDPSESEAGQEAVKEAEESMDAVEGGAKDPSESEAGQEAVKEAEESMDAVEEGGHKESEIGQEAKEADASMDVVGEEPNGNNVETAPQEDSRPLEERLVSAVREKLLEVKAAGNLESLRIKDVSLPVAKRLKIDAKTFRRQIKETIIEQLKIVFAEPEEPVEKPKKKKKKRKPPKSRPQRTRRRKPSPSPSSSEGEEKREETDTPRKKKKKPATASKRPVREPATPSSSSSSSSSSEEPEQRRKKKAPARRSKTAAPTSVGISERSKVAVEAATGKADGYHVFDDGENLYCAMLNQTDVTYNVRGHNKFYQIQLLQSDDDSDNLVFTRWGRVGARNPQQRELKFHTDLAAAVTKFRAVFRAKTGNVFGQEPFTPIRGKYLMLDMHLSGAGSEEVKRVEELLQVLSSEPVGSSELHPSVEDLVRLIFSKKTLMSTLTSLQIDVERLPLGTLSATQISRGYSVLNEIESCLQRADTSGGILEHLTNEFFTNIPHDFGMNLPPVIRSLADVEEKMVLLDTLHNIVTATGIMTGADDCDDNGDDESLTAAERLYLRMQCGLSLVDGGNASVEIIQKMVENTHAPTHRSYTLEVTEVFEVEKKGDAERFLPFKKLPNRFMLWHGSRLGNAAGILSKGLRIAPPEAPMTGYMFGKGIYLASVCSKAANYCHATPDEPFGLLYLCEAACGRMYERTESVTIRAPPAPFHSLKGVGRHEIAETDPFPVDNDDDAIVTPTRSNANMFAPALAFTGHCESIQDPSNEATASSLLFDEYVLYDESQVRVRYVVKVKFHFG